MRRVLAASGMVIAVGLGQAQPAANAQAAGASDSAVMAEASSDPSRLTLKTDRVVIFKDGYAMIMKSATGVVDDAGRVYTDNVPDTAVLGTFWASREGGEGGDGGGELLGMHAELVDSESEKEKPGVALSMHELLRSNVGKKVSIRLTGDKGEKLAGTIERVLERPAMVPEAEPAPAQPQRFDNWGNLLPPEPPGAESERVVSMDPVGATYVLIRSEGGGSMVLPIVRVESIEGDAISTSVTKKTKIIRKSKRLSFNVGSASKGQSARLNIAYFSPGVRWVPTYRLSLDESPEGGTGSLSLQGEVMNELEDFRGASVDLVVGVPNFRFKDVVSPLSVESVMRDLSSRLTLVRPSRLSNAYQSASFSQRANEWRGRDEGGSAVGGGVNPDGGEVVGAGEQDLFIYSAPLVSVKKGDRASTPLWTQEVPFSHLYTFDVHVVRDRNSQQTYYRCGPSYASGSWQPPSDRDSPTKLSTNEVWHQLELTNAQQRPWTTGAALVLGKTSGVPICQELLTYTSKGQKTLMPLTVAVDVRSEFIEEELSRQTRDLASTSYQFVKVKGTSTLTNNRSSAINLRIENQLGGKVTGATENGKILVQSFDSRDWGNGSYWMQPNSHSKVTWDMTLAPGETKRVSYEVEYYWKP